MGEHRAPAHLPRLVFSQLIFESADWMLREIASRVKAKGSPWTTTRPERPLLAQPAAVTEPRLDN